MTDESIQPEGTDPLFHCGGIIRFPAGRLPLHGDFVRNTGAFRADIGHGSHFIRLFAFDFRGFVLIANVFPADFMKLSAVGALGFPALHTALVEALFDSAGAFDGRGRDFHSFRVIERCLPCHSQIPRIALSSSGCGPAIPFVSDDIADWFRGEGVCFRGTAEGKDAAGVSFLQEGIAAVAAFGNDDFPPQGWTVPDHRRDTEFGKFFRVNRGRMDKENTAGVLINDVPDNIQFAF